MLRIVDLAFERPVRLISDFAEALGVSYQGSANNINEPIAHGVAEDVGGTYPKLIRFPGVLEAFQVGEPHKGGPPSSEIAGQPQHITLGAHPIALSGTL